MNKKTNRSSLRAPTTQPAAAIAPSATLGLDGELPVSASNGVTAPEPLAAHDVLQAAMAPREDGQLDGTADTLPADAPDAAVKAAPADAAENSAPAAAVTTGTSKKAGKKPAKTASKAADKPAARPTQEKFVKCTFALPESEMLVLDAMKKTHKANGVALKKSQLLRAGLLALADVDAERLAQLVAQLPAGPAAGRKKK